MQRKFLAANAVSAVFGMGFAANAAVIKGADVNTGSTTGTTGGFTFKATNGNFGLKIDDGGTITRLGVSGGPSGNEINFTNNESIKMTRTDDRGTFHVKELKLGLLFDGPEFGDFQEKAVLKSSAQSDIVIENVFNSTGDYDVDVSARRTS